MRQEAAKKEENKGPPTSEFSSLGNEGLVSFEIEKAKKAGMNILLPSTHIEGLSEFHHPVIDYVELSPEPAQGDVYFHSESGKFVPAKQGLMKLALCAGIMWNAAETKRTDNRQDRDYVSYQAVGGVRKADGSPVWLKAEYDMDFEVIEEELREQYEKTGKKNKKSGEELQDYIDYCVKRDLLFKRKNKVKLCEAGAMNRVVRALLGLKAGYTQAELKKPFVVARIVFRPDYSDPEIRRIMLQKSMESVTGVYGPVAPDAPSVDLSDVGPTIDVETLPGTDEPISGKEEEAEIPEPGGPDDDLDGLSHEEADFMAADKETQIDTLEKLSKRKGYDLKQLKRPINTFTKVNREGFFDKLMGMPDDDIPF